VSSNETTIKLIACCMTVDPVYTACETVVVVVYDTNNCMRDLHFEPFELVKMTQKVTHGNKNGAN